MSSADEGARIGIEAHGIGERPTGVGTYVYKLVEALGRVAPREPLVLYRNTTDGPQLPFPTLYVPPSPLWTTARLPLHFALHGAPPVMLFPGHSRSLYCPGRSAVTIHDLAFELFPDHFTAADRLRLRLTTRNGVTRADRLIAVSEATKRDVVERMGAAPDRVTVVHHGVDHAVFRPSTAGEVDAVRARHGLHRPYVLAVGTLQRRKNHATLIRAVHILRGRGVDVELVLSGAGGWLFDETRRLVDELGMGDAVRFLGYVPLDELPALYAGASAAALLSLYEGFGLPVLEAMACGVPMLVSDTSSLPEVGGDAVLKVPPMDLDAVVSALDRLLHDDALRADLSARGIRRAAGFTWEATARGTLSILRDLL
ncbi:MAG TPA: glycosyltransferase family 1 protein [Longimicrobiaceae bacterium]|nr:glycosyltransferase family 1 protein [Longimicrobiaceae bacterium]